MCSVFTGSPVSRDCAHGVARTSEFTIPEVWSRCLPRLPPAGKHVILSTQRFRPPAPEVARSSLLCRFPGSSQMAANGVGETLSAEEACGEDTVLSLQDVLEEDDALQDEACAVLGGSDSEKCSYPQGFVKRQALYACNTCTPDKEEPAGICLACTYKCHEGHDLFELYTKRNFRCDCGNSKFRQLECKLFPDKENVNALNKYNANFFGLYCTCKRPYPDPEDEVPDEMIQCIVCEDWYHGRHLGASPPEHMEFHEMICQACMDRCSFLWAYTAHLAVPGVTRITPADTEHNDVEVEDEPTEDVKAEEQKVEISNHLNAKEEGAEQTSPSTSAASEQKCDKDVKTGSTCKLQEYKAQQGPAMKTATYWSSNWRRKLCTCKDCMMMYTHLEVLFLVDECDTVQAYENKGKTAEAQERRDPLMTALSNMNRVQQVELISEYNDLKTELTDYLKRFAEEQKVVKAEDIQQFFEDLRSRKRRRVDDMQYYCS